jgi:hypothetical protein
LADGIDSLIESGLRLAFFVVLLGGGRFRECGLEVEIYKKLGTASRVFERVSAMQAAATSGDWGRSFARSHICTRNGEFFVVKFRGEIPW